MRFQQEKEKIREGRHYTTLQAYMSKVSHIYFFTIHVCDVRKRHIHKSVLLKCVCVYRTGGVSCGRKKMGITINNKQFNTDVAAIMNTLLNISNYRPLMVQ